MDFVKQDIIVEMYCTGKCFRRSKARPGPDDLPSTRLSGRSVRQGSPSVSYKSAVALWFEGGFCSREVIAFVVTVRVCVRV